MTLPNQFQKNRFTEQQIFVDYITSGVLKNKSFKGILTYEFNKEVEYDQSLLSFHIKVSVDLDKARLGPYKDTKLDFEITSEHLSKPIICWCSLDYLKHWMRDFTIRVNGNPGPCALYVGNSTVPFKYVQGLPRLLYSIYLFKD